VVAVNQWGTETPLAWRSTQGEKPLWDIMYDPLVMRDSKTYEFTPGLALNWDTSADFRTWTFKLRQGVMFHGTWGEMTSDDVKFTVEQNLKPDAPGGDGPYFRSQLAGIDAPDKYTVVMHFKDPQWDVLTHFAQMTGYQQIMSKKHVESVGEDQASQAPIGTGAYQHVEGLQGQSHTFEAAPNHWRSKPAYQRITIRRITEPGTALSALRAGEVDLIPVGGDNIDQAKKFGFRLHETPQAVMHWLILPGQTVPGRDDYQPQQTPWADDPNDRSSVQRALQIRLAMNLAVNRKAIYDAIYRGYSTETPFSYWYFPVNKGYIKGRDWAVEPYDLDQAKKIMADQGVKGFSINMNTVSAQVDAADMVEAVAQDWEKIGITINRVKEDTSTFQVKARNRKTGVTGQLYAPPSPLDEPSLLWQRCINTRGALHLLAEGPWDQQLDAIAAELDSDKRTALTATLGTQLVNEHRGIRIGMKSALWAVSKKVGNWTPLASVSYETNYDTITA
jgi:peptide/nickel transport system substrate-binding protein